MLNLNQLTELPGNTSQQNKVEKISKSDQTGVPLHETCPPPTSREYCRAVFYTPFDAELKVESESAHSIARQYFTRDKISKKRSKTDKIGVPPQQTSAPPTRRKYCRAIFYISFNAELKAESESAR
jgi:hypothetical protein